MLIIIPIVLQGSYPFIDIKWTTPNNVARAICSTTKISNMTGKKVLYWLKTMLKILPTSRLVIPAVEVV